MKHLLILISALTLILPNTSFGQGQNNNYDIDSEDLKNIFKEQGINIFKYSFELEKGEYISISYEIYENKKIVDEKNVIEDIQIDNDMRFDHHLSRKDTIVLHRFYFFKENDTLSMRQKLPGVELVQKIDLSNVEIGDFNSRTGVDLNLPGRQEILFYYGLLKKNEGIKKTNGWLTCSSGISKDKLITDYDFVILFYAEKITKERTKTIIEEIKPKKPNKN